ncbi:AAA family ATPase [Pelotomaculum propionicicum]|uniref:AAA family ATPase n=1 Tax=Pelotomaculum propionicicum TaxID=258475 RepID=UPI003B78AE59
MIKLAIAGPQDFTEYLQRRLQREAKEITLINVTNEPVYTMESIENPKLNADVFLLGYDDREIELLADVAIRNKMKSVIFVSTDDPSKVFLKWAKYKIKAAKRNREIDSILEFFKERPELIRNKTSPQVVYDQEEQDDSATRIEMVKNKGVGSHSVFEKKVIVVYGPKGGIGKSVTVISMAKSLVALANLRVAILDLEFNRDYGDVMRYFGVVGGEKDKTVDLKPAERFKGLALPSEKTLLGWSRFPWELRHNREVVEESLVKFSNNLYYLPPMRSMMDEKNITIELVQKTIDVLKRHFQVVLVDGSNTLTDATIGAIEMSDNLLLMTTASMTIIDSLSDFVFSTINRIEGSPTTGIIVNELDDLDSSVPSDINKITGFVVQGILPRDEELRKMVNNSYVPYIGANDIPYTRGIQRLLSSLFPMANLTNAPEPKRNFLSGFLKKFRKASA